MIMAMQAWSLSGGLCSDVMNVQPSAGLCSGTGRRLIWDSACELGKRIRVPDSDVGERSL